MLDFERPVSRSTSRRRMSRLGSVSIILRSSLKTLLDVMERECRVMTLGGGIPHFLTDFFPLLMVFVFLLDPAGFNLSAPSISLRGGSLRTRNFRLEDRSAASVTFAWAKSRAR